MAWDKEGLYGHASWWTKVDAVAFLHFNTLGAWCYAFLTGVSEVHANTRRFPAYCNPTVVRRALAKHHG